MLELFRRMWLGWNVAVRKFVSAQTFILMAVTWIVGIAPVAIALKLLRKPMLDRAPADPGAASYGTIRDGKPMGMEQASRMF